MNIDPRLLSYLSAIDYHGTFTRAAAAEGLSQPALTSKIGLLERQLDAKLIDRGRHGARLNEYGKLLLRHASMIENTLERAAREVELTKSGESGPLFIGATPISIVELLPRALELLESKKPKTQITIIEADDDVLLDKLLAGEIEVMLGGMISGRSEPEVIQEHLANFPLDLVVGRASPFWHADSVTLQDVIDQPWALPASGSVIRSYVDAIFVGAGLDLPPSYWSCVGMGALRSIVRQTQRVTVMPRHAIRLEAELGVMRGVPLLSPTSSRRMHILRLDHTLQSPVALELIANLHDAAKQMQA